MNTEMFVAAIKRHVRDAAIDDTIKKLVSPPGRRVSDALKARSAWYNNLHEADAALVRDIISCAVDEAIFGIFAVLDGSRVIDDGRFQLLHVGEEQVLLNDPEKIGLNEVFNATK
jgi:hypothetical protein